MTLNFLVPVVIDRKPRVLLVEDDIADSTNKWNNALILYTMGKVPSFTYLKVCIMRNWNTVTQPELY